MTVSCSHWTLKGVVGCTQEEGAAMVQEGTVMAQEKGVSMAQGVVGAQEEGAVRDK